MELPGGDPAKPQGELSATIPDCRSSACESVGRKVVHGRSRNRRQSGIKLAPESD